MHRSGERIRCNVEGLTTNNNTEPVYFTIHKGNQPILNFLHVQRPHKRSEDTAQVYTDKSRMADAYALATYSSESEGLGFPILANHKYGWEPGQKRSVDLGTSITFSSLRTGGPNNEPFMLRPIPVETGIVLATATRQGDDERSNVSLTIHNCRMKI